MQSNELPPVHSRDSSGTALYEKFCSSCGAVAIVDRRRLTSLCRKCSPFSRRTHGLSSGNKLDPIYRVFLNIKARCYSSSATHYSYYGGRGIAVDQQWLNDPARFVAWATENNWSQGMEVDRIDSNGNYSPENCRLISHRENSQRTRRIKTTPAQVIEVRRLLTLKIPMKEVAEKAGVTYMVAWHIKNSPDVWSNI